MTGYTVNTGSTTKFSEGWDRVFGAGKAAKPSKKAVAEPKSAPAAKKAPAKAAGAKTVKSKQTAQKALTSGKR